MTPQTQTPKPKQVKGEKTLCNVKCSDGYPYTIQLVSREAPGPSWLVLWDEKYRNNFKRANNLLRTSGWGKTLM